MGLNNNSFDELCLELYSPAFINALKAQDLENVTTQIQPTVRIDEGGEELPYYYFYIDSGIYDKALNLLLHFQLENHISDICLILKKGYCRKIVIENSKPYIDELKSLYENIDKEHTTIRFVGNRKDEDIAIQNAGIIALLKSTIVNLILHKQNIQFDLADCLTKQYYAQKINALYFEIMNDIATKLQDINNSEQKGLSENKIYALTYDLQEYCILLPNEQLQANKVDGEKSSYVRQSLNNYKRKYQQNENEEYQCYDGMINDEYISQLNEISKNIDSLTVKYKGYI